jgi:hypothetical protein
MGNFNYYCNLFGSDKGDAFFNSNHYADWYQKWFAPIRDQVTNICEIGVYNGSSTKAFKSYFHNAEIIGLDIDDKSQYNEDRIITKICDQSNPQHLQSFVDECNLNNLKFDIILDDGSHDVSHQQLSFGKLFQLIKPGGFYIIEDLCASHFVLGQELYGYITSEDKKKNNTHIFLVNRPFKSPWISETDLKYLEDNIDYISTFDRWNRNHVVGLHCDNNYPARSITSIIKKV